MGQKRSKGTLGPAGSAGWVLPRRHFLGAVGGGLAGVAGVGCGTPEAGKMAAPPQGPSSEQPPTEQPPTENPPEEERAFEGPLGVALLGLGSYASEQLAPALQLTQQCRLVGLVTGTPSKAPQWQAKYGIPVENSYSYETLAQIRDNPDIHVVYVVTPPSLHKKYAIAAAEAGKHVWCEKPMALSEQECRDMIAACQQNGVKLCIGYRMQHEPNTRTVIEYATSRPYGKIVRVDALAGYSGYHGGDTNVWRLDGSMGGGALYDMGVYTINAARYATGEEPIQVRSASQWTERPDLFMGIDEWTEFELVFPSGAIAYGRTSFGENINSLDVECATGSYRLAPMQQYTGVKGSTSDGVALDRPIDNQQARQMDDDALAIIEGRDVIAPGEEGLRDIILITAIRQAALTGMPVDLV